MLRQLTSFCTSSAFALTIAASVHAQAHTYTFDSAPQALQTFTVPAGASLLSIKAIGASGGRHNSTNGGRGGRISGDLIVTPGMVLTMLVGRQGQSTIGGSHRGAGGGGGTFLYVGDVGYAGFSTPLLVAGGGGGAGGALGGNGTGGGLLHGGNGQGGAGSCGAGGGGILGNGGAGSLSSTGGRAAVNQGSGGAGACDGGYGGGGAGSGALNSFIVPGCGGGGGGYTGGKGGHNTNTGGGGLGGRYYASAAMANVVSSVQLANDAHGSVEIVVHYGIPTTHTFDFTGSLQTFVVPAGAALMTIEAEAGSGGGSNAIVGGSGGRITGNVSLAPGTTLQLLVGGRGQGGNQSWGGAGGGGTFVAVGTNGNADFASPLLVAGGGGGRGHVAPAAGGHGGELLGGTGQGGVHASSAGSGAGILSDGSNGTIAFGGEAPIHGGAGGTGDRIGGYGGGGGSANNRAGGGGGYTGGIAGTGTNTSTGGTSFAAPSMRNVINEPGVIINTNGRVTITVYYTAQVKPTGQGCAGDTLAANSVPWTNATFSATGTNLPQVAFVCAVTGFRETSLPLVLAFPQAQVGCDLLVSADLIELIPTTNGTATSQLPLPNDPSLGGQVFFQQMVSLGLDATFAITDVTATNALRATIGL